MACTVKLTPTNKNSLHHSPVSLLLRDHITIRQPSKHGRLSSFTSNPLPTRVGGGRIDYGAGVMNSGNQSNTITTKENSSQSVAVFEWDFPLHSDDEIAPPAQTFGSIDIRYSYEIDYF